MLGNHAKPTSMTLDNLKYPNKRKQVYLLTFMRIDFLFIKYSTYLQQYIPPKKLSTLPKY